MIACKFINRLRPVRIVRSTKNMISTGMSSLGKRGVFTLLSNLTTLLAELWVLLNDVFNLKAVGNAAFCGLMKFRVVYNRILKR